MERFPGAVSHRHFAFGISQNRAGSDLSDVKLSSARLSRAAFAAAWIHLSAPHDSCLRVDGEYTDAAAGHQFDYSCDRRGR